MTSASDAGDARSVSAAIGRNYDVLVYEPEVKEAAEAIEPGAVLGLSGVYGCAPAADATLDVLDLGCGTGTQLYRAGSRANGRLVGADISAAACERARERCAEFGDRVRIISGDFLDLSPEMLGKFDLIYCVGVIFLTPPAVQAKILDLIGQCLKPGGAALVTYYAGSLPHLRAGLHRILRGSVDPAQPQRENIARARQIIDQIAAMLPATGTHRRVLTEVLEHARKQNDTLFFHEALNHAFAVLDTSALDTALARHAVRFLNYMTPNTFGALPQPHDRALAADVIDFAGGGSYRYTVFGKPTGGGSVSLRSPALRWRSRLMRADGGISYAAPATFRDAAMGTEIQIVQSHTQAALDLLAVNAATWPEIWEGARVRLAGRRITPIANAETYLEQDLIELWQGRLVMPTWETRPR